ncbi:H-NS histone family protein [Niveibacterium sp. SC-1]|uniref:H-NS histone family protein n=1 Tax=Niveibacterium sp. SC-1 TaxID=3135646 RepID=UPI00311F7CF6
MADIQGLSIQELKGLAKKIEREIEKRADLATARVLKEVQKLAKAAGLELSDLLGTPARKKRQAAAPVALDDVAPVKRKPRAKYSNPADPAQKWTGRGRKPRWVEAHLASGGALEVLEIKRQRTTAKA